MDYLLDTNICIHYFKGQFELKNKIEQIGFRKFAISEITLAELIYGAEKSQMKSKNIKVVEDFAEKVTIIPIFDGIRIYDKEKARLKLKGTIISDLGVIDKNGVFLETIVSCGQIWCCLFYARNIII